MYKRFLQLNLLLKKNSFFLFGPRGTGKSTLIRQQLKPKLQFDLLDSGLFARLASDPSILYQSCQSLRAGELVVIDEVQRVPEILNEVHRLIEEKSIRFLLTGSSARKLKRGAANLMAGRAWRSDFFPLTSNEIDDFDLIRYLNRGGLPRSYLSEDPEEELHAYLGVYLKEEILAEALSRNIQAFSRFLEVMALQNGEELALQAIASDVGLSANGIRGYLDILVDTLVGFEVPAFQKTKKRKAITRSKFFLFDVGVVGALLHREIKGNKSSDFGKAFEHFIACELRAYLSYRRLRLELSYWRSTSQFAVDFVIGSEIAVEVKSTVRVDERDLKGLRALKEEQLQKRYVLVSLDPMRRVIDGIELLPYEHFLKELWGDKLLSPPKLER